MPSSCPFCQKLSGIDPWPAEEVVWQFPQSVAILGSWQFYHGYCVLIARQHASELSQLGDAERRGYLEEMCTLARALEQALHPRKLNCELLGNQVPHLHWHLFPRYEIDPEHLKPVWVTLDRAERDESERQRLQRGPRQKADTVRLIQDHLARSAHDD